jgi:hypothetical protein
MQRKKDGFNGVDTIEQAKDIFIFSCYTGLAYSDVFNLRQNNIVRGIDGDYWLYTSRKKTDVSVHIPLLPLTTPTLPFF